jgi:hypothetical protein
LASPPDEASFYSISRLAVALSAKGWPKKSSFCPQLARHDDGQRHCQSKPEEIAKMKPLIAGLLASALITGTAKAVECSDLPQDVMDKVLIEAAQRNPDNMERRERFIDIAVHDLKIELATREALRRRQQQQQPQAK